MTITEILTQKQQLERLIAEFQYQIDAMIHALSLLSPEVTLTVPKPPVVRDLDANAHEVWQLIAQRCHPDKDHSGKLAPVFKQAKKCKDEGDSSGLYFCYLEMTQLIEDKSFITKFLLNSKIYEFSLETLQHRLDFMQHSFYGKLLTLYLDDVEAAAKVFKEFCTINKETVA